MATRRRSASAKQAFLVAWSGTCACFLVAYILLPEHLRPWLLGGLLALALAALAAAWHHDSVAQRMREITAQRSRGVVARSTRPTTWTRAERPEPPVQFEIVYMKDGAGRGREIAR
jgi:hypothetical protein